jgi:hypothetical protein
MAETPATVVPVDVVWGAREIARLIGKTPRATFHLLEKGQLPARKIGKQWVASQKALRAHLEGAPT